MASSYEVRAHDPAAHKRWEVDWSDWLTARGFLEDGSEIVSTNFTLDLEGGSTTQITFQDLSGAVARVWINGISLNEEVLVIAEITMPQPDVSAPNVQDRFRFKLRGTPT